MDDNQMNQNPYGQPTEPVNPYGAPVPEAAPAADANPYTSPVPEAAPAADANPYTSPVPEAAPAADANPYTSPIPEAAPAADANPYTGQPAMEPVQDPYGQPEQEMDMFGNPVNNSQPSAGQSYGSQPGMGGQDPYGQPQNIGGQDPYGQPQNMGGQDPYGQPQNMGGQDPYGQPQNFGAAPATGMNQSYGAGQTGGSQNYGSSPYSGNQTYSNSVPNYQTSSYTSAEPEDGKALGGLICSILSVLCCFGIITAPIGMILSRTAINAGNTSGKARAGWVLGIIGLIINILIIVGYIVFGIMVAKEM